MFQTGLFLHQWRIGKPVHSAFLYLALIPYESHRHIVGATGLLDAPDRLHQSRYA